MRWTITPARHFHLAPLRFLYRLNKRMRGRGVRRTGSGAAASFGTLKVGSAAINLGVDCLERKNYYAKL